MKKFFQNKRNIALTASAAVLLIVVAIVIAVTVTAKHRAAYEPVEPESQTVSETDAPAISETEPETETEPMSASATEPSSKKTDTKKKNTNNQSKDKEKDKDKGSSNKDPNTPVKITPPWESPKDGLIGSWYTNESVAPSELLSEDFISITGFNTDMKVHTIYRFSTDNSFSIEYHVTNFDEYEDALYTAFATYFKATEPGLSPEEFEYKVDKSASYTVNELCQAVIGVWGDQGYIAGTYSYDDTTIRYQCQGESFSETYTLDGDTLKLTGSSLGNEGYPLTLKRS